MKKVKKFTSIDYFELYRLLFNNEEVFYKVASGIKLPKNISTIIKRTKQDIENGCLSYEDSAPLLYLKFKIEGVKLFSDIKYVVIDEAQDYYPIHYEIFKLIFKKDTKYTVLGDIHQTIEKKVDMSFYNNIIAILNGKKAARVLLNKSYRSSYEICSFAQRFLNEEQEIIPFERHERMPEIIFKNTVEELIKLILKDIKEFIKSGYETIAIICKTNSEAEKLYNKVKNSMKIKLINSNNENVEKGVIILPSYIAKGLEFDVVLAFNFKVNYNNDIERRLLYIVCTRALHRLVLYSVN
jgi:DNA helicase-2/ATP-dependent DNA helicase PcrA